MATQLKIDNEVVDQPGIDEHNQEMINLVESQEIDTSKPDQ